MNDDLEYKTILELEAEQKILESKLQKVKHLIFWKKHEMKNLLGEENGS